MNVQDFVYGIQASDWIREPILSSTMYGLLCCATNSVFNKEISIESELTDE